MTKPTERKTDDNAMYQQAIAEAKQRGDAVFCSWCWNKPTYAEFWTDSQENRWCKRCQPRETT